MWSFTGYVIIVCILFKIWNTIDPYKENKGENEGERIVKKTIKESSLNKEEYHLVNNITIPTKEGTTQIDHILFTKHGIFVIETKNYKGWIFGKEDDYKWTQVLFKNKYTFQNPIRQNENHIKHLKKELHYLKKEVFFNIIVFTGESEFKRKMPENVMETKELINYIKRKKIRISDLELFAGIGNIEFIRKPRSKNTDDEHIKYVKNKKSSRYQ